MPPLPHAVTAVAATLWFVAGAWLWKAVSAARGMRRVPNLLDDAYDRDPPAGASLVAIVPACNEAVSIECCVRSLLLQQLEDFHIVAVDDRSTDATGAILDRVAREASDRLTVLHVSDLPEGWLGKTHAMALAARHAEAMYRPRWLLFTDGDVFFAPDALRRSLHAAAAANADHFVTLPTPIIKRRSEGMMMGFLQVLGLWATRLWRVSDPAARDAIGIGAFNLIRAKTYADLGGFAALRMEILEDLTLARRVKQRGFRQRAAFGPGLVTLHWATGAQGVVRTMTKNLFAIFRFRAALLLLACGWLSLLCLAPFAGVLFAPTRTASLVALLAIASLYRTTGRFSGIAALNFFAFPVAAVLFVYSLLRSTAVTLRNGGVEWRGTFYPLAELRRHGSGPL